MKIIKFRNGSTIEHVNTGEVIRGKGWFIKISEPIYHHYLCYTEKDEEKGWEILSEFWMLEYCYDK